jgi:hypothetical protein
MKGKTYVRLAVMNAKSTCRITIKPIPTTVRSGSRTERTAGVNNS